MSRYKTNVALLILGDRVPRGTEIELSDEAAAGLDPADITAVAAIAAAAPEAEVTPASVEEMSLAQLKERAKELGLAVNGSKADILERIALHLEGTAAEDAETEEEITNA
jgi:pyruvate kinase